MEELLEALHRPAPTISTDLETWGRAYRTRPTRTPFHDAAFGGRSSGTIGLAFLAGYQASLRRLLPGLPREKLVALAATEAGGGHPKAIETCLESGTLSGKKRYVTLGALADILLVVARRVRGERDLILVQLEANAPGVVLTALPPTPFVPDVPHAELALDTPEASVSVLPGDGYLDYLKPFRTVEDLHVQVALLGHAAERARASFAPKLLRERLSSVIASLAQLADLPPLSPALHVALGGSLAASKEILIQLSEHLSSTNDPAARAWSRDLAVLEVAGSARNKRLERAWEAFG